MYEVYGFKVDVLYLAENDISREERREKENGERTSTGPQISLKSDNHRYELHYQLSVDL